MATYAPRPKKISDFKPTLTKLAQTSHYEVKFDVPRGVRQSLEARGVSNRFIGETVGLLCNDAVIPGSSLATADVTGPYQGLSEKFAHTRLFTDMTLNFYVDDEYKVLKFLEHWIEFIAGGSEGNSLRDGYHFRMRYPKSYKSDTTRIKKFERDYDKAIEYSFVGLFPKFLTPTRVSYDGSQILQASCTFSYDRYVAGRVSSKSWFFGFDRNFVANNLLNKSVLSSNEVTGKVESAGLRNDSPEWTAPTAVNDYIPNAKQQLLDSGFNSTILEGINDIEAGRDRG